MEFKVGQHMWLNIKDFKMSDGLAPCFPTKYPGLYEIVAKLQFNVYTLKFCCIHDFLCFKIKVVYEG